MNNNFTANHTTKEITNTKNGTTPNMFQLFLTDSEYSAFEKIAKKLNVDVDELIKYSAGRPPIICLTTKERKKNAIKVFRKILDMLNSFTNVMFDKNKDSEQFTKYCKCVRFASDFLRFTTEYDDDFMANVQNELSLARVEGCFDRNTFDNDIAENLDRNITSFFGLEYYHILEAYSLFFNDDFQITEFMHLNITQSATRLDDADYAVAIMYKKIKKILKKHFGKYEFSKKDARKLAKNELNVIFSELLYELYGAGFLLTSLVVSNSVLVMK